MRIESHKKDFQKVHRDPKNFTIDQKNKKQGEKHILLLSNSW